MSSTSILSAVALAVVTVSQKLFTRIAVTVFSGHPLCLYVTVSTLEVAHFRRRGSQPFMDVPSCVAASGPCPR